MTNRVSGARANVEAGSSSDRTCTFGKPLLPISTSGEQMLPILNVGNFEVSKKGAFLLFLRQSFASYRGTRMGKVTGGEVVVVTGSMSWRQTTADASN